LIQDLNISYSHIDYKFSSDNSNHGIAISRLIKYLGLKQMRDYQER